jgi:hypothetical protein
MMLGSMIGMGVSEAKRTAAAEQSAELDVTEAPVAVAQNPPDDLTKDLNALERDIYSAPAKPLAKPRATKYVPVKKQVRRKGGKRAYPS